MVEALVPDPRVEKLEQEIGELRREIGGFIGRADSDLRELKHGIDQVNGHVADVLYEIGTVPDHRYRDPERLTVTKRLHQLENDKDAAKMMTAALEQIRTSKLQGWTRLQKIGLFGFASVGCVVAIIGLVQNLT